MTDGWIALHRKIYQSKDFNNQLEVAIFLYMVSMASHKISQVVYRKKLIKLNRGEICIAYRDLAKKFNLSVRNIRTIISNLIKSGNVKQTLHKNLSIYVIVKYNKYQNLEAEVKQKLTNRTTTITNTIIGNKHMKRQYPILKPLKDKIKEPIKPLNEWQVAKSKLTDAEYEIWVKSRLNS